MQIAIFLILLTKFHTILTSRCDSEVTFDFDNNHPWNTKLILGSGTFGTVFKYYVEKNDITNGKKVKLYGKYKYGTLIPIALKVLHNTKGSFDQRYKLTKELEEEVDNLKLVNNISQEISPIFYRCGKTYGGTMFIAMEYIQESLDKALKSKCNYHIRDRLYMYADLMYVTMKLHAQHRSHCDLKPQNIGYDSELRFKLLDLGIMAKNGKCSIGTPYYIAPEVEGVNTSPKDTASDIYSLGMMFWYIEDNCRKRILKENSIINKNSLKYFIRTVKNIKDTSVQNAKDKPKKSPFYNFRVLFFRVMYRVLSSMVNFESYKRPNADQLRRTFVGFKYLYGRVDKIRLPLLAEENQLVNKFTTTLSKLDKEGMDKLSDSEISKLEEIVTYKPEAKNNQENLPRNNHVKYRPRKNNPNGKHMYVI